MQTRTDPTQLFDCEVLDSDGNKIGTVDSVWVDNATDQLEFIGVKTGWFMGKTHIIPTANAQITSSNLSPLQSSSMVLRKTTSRPSTPFFFSSDSALYNAARKFSDWMGSSRCGIPAFLSSSRRRSTSSSTTSSTQHTGVPPAPSVTQQPSSHTGAGKHTHQQSGGNSKSSGQGKGNRSSTPIASPPKPVLPSLAGAPTASSPAFSFAFPGPAPIGVPNFFIDSFRIPPFLLPIYQAAGIEYDVPWQLLAAINEIETDYGRNLSVSTAGAVGWMQFLPSTWAKYGVDVQYTPFDNVNSGIQRLASGAVTPDVMEITPDTLDIGVAGKLVKPLNLDYIPNLQKNVWPQLVDPFYDGESRYTVPYTCYATGIAWRTDEIKKDIAGMNQPWDIFWESQAYKGKVALSGWPGSPATSVTHVPLSPVGR